jgi:hypothetical protein
MANGTRPKQATDVIDDVMRGGAAWFIDQEEAGRGIHEDILRSIDVPTQDAYTAA